MFLTVIKITDTQFYISIGANNPGTNSEGYKVVYGDRPDEWMDVETFRAAYPHTLSED